MIHARRPVRTVLIGLLTLGAVTLRAQSPPPAPVQPAQAQTAAAPAIPRVTLAAWRSVVLATDFEITRIAITNPAIADATVVAPQEILIDGKSPGTVSLIVWGESRRAQYDLVVDPGVSALQRTIQTLFPGEDIQTNETPEAVILTGHASDNNVMLRAAEIAEAISPKSKVINLLQLPGGLGSQQVMLQVRIAEVNRRAMLEVGASIFTGATSSDIIARTTTQQFAAPTIEDITRTTVDGKITGVSGTATFSDLLNLFVFSANANVGVLIKALQQSGNFQALAEPNLVAYNGQEASFLAGGELPIPVVQGNQGNVSIQYKEFGVRLNFKPTIAGDVIRLKVRPEVSALDFVNGVSIGGFRVPALTTRRAETDVELRDGQTFAIAGLLNNVSQDTRQGIPVLSSIPLIGYLFKSRATNRDRTELMILVTPHLVRALNPDEVPPLPVIPEKFLPPCEKPPCDGSTPAKKPSGG